MSVLLRSHTFCTDFSSQTRNHWVYLFAGTRSEQAWGIFKGSSLLALCCSSDCRLISGQMKSLSSVLARMWMSYSGLDFPGMKLVSSQSPDLWAYLFHCQMDHSPSTLQTALYRSHQHSWNSLKTSLLFTQQLPSNREYIGDKLLALREPPPTKSVWEVENSDILWVILLRSCLFFPTALIPP